MRQTILVLGATGKSGRRLLPRLRVRGVDARAASRKPRDGHIVFDWDRDATYDAALVGVSAVYLITPDFVEDPSRVVGTFLERAKRAGVQRVVAVSSMGVEFPTEPSTSGRRKVEQLVRGSGLAWTLLRPGGFAQNFSEGFALPGIVHGDLIASAAGDGAVAFIDADDIAAVAAAALLDNGHDGAEHVLTGPTALTLTEIATIISEAAGRTISYRSLPSSAMVDILQGAGVPADYGAIVVRDMEAIRAGYGARVTSVVADVTGREPTTFAEYAHRAADAWKRGATK